MPSSDLLKIYQWGRRAAVEGGEEGIEATSFSGLLSPTPRGPGNEVGMEAATVCFILCFFGYGKFIFIREMSGNFEH